MHPAYFETRFRVPKPIPDWPDGFAVISAWPTTGESWPEDEIRSADASLESELHKLGVWMTRVIGYSPSTGHAEPSWAVAVRLEQACAIALRYKQDAVYVVEGDLLFVSHCDARRRLVPVGQFRERVD